MNVKTVQEFSEEWKKVWEKLIGQSEANESKWSNAKSQWREPFQLLGASLLYTYNAIKLMPEDMLQKTVRDAMPDQDSKIVWNSLKGKEPGFPQNNADEKFKKLASTMHVASSSFRLTTALFLIHQELLNNNASAPLVGFLKNSPPDWDRKKLTPCLRSTNNLNSCANGTPLDEETALAMTLAYRDEFGHGEEGAGSEWAKIRRGCVDQFVLCRIIEAQLLLAELGVKELAKIK